MAFKFRRSIKIAPGLRLNLTHRGVSARVGGRGFGYTVNANGRQHISAGIPGSGIHISEQIAPPRKNQPKSGPVTHVEALEPASPDESGGAGGGGRIVAWIIVGMIVFMIGVGISQTAMNDGLPQAASLIFALGFIGSLPWLLISLLRMIPKRTRSSGKRQSGYALIGALVSFFAVIALGISQAPAPSTSPQPVAVVAPSTEVLVADLSDDDAFEIALADTAPIPTVRPQQYPSAVMGTNWVTSDRLDLRSCPDESCGLSTRLIFREIAEVEEVQNGWGRVSRYINAPCESGRTSYLTGRDTCTSENGFVDGRYAQWAKLEFLSPQRPDEPGANATGLARLVAQSTDFRLHEAAFVKAAKELIDSRRCTEAHFLEVGGWMSSPEKQSIYFTYCGQLTARNRFYLDVTSGRIFQ